jgi:type II secretory pathway pseudopilin PulG
MRRSCTGFEVLSPKESRRGASIAEVLVVLLIVLVVIALVLMALPRSRETARIAKCQQHMGWIGQALGAYDASTGRLPGVNLDAPPGSSPLLVLEEFLSGHRSSAPERDAKGNPDPLSAVSIEYLCPSDPTAVTFGFPLPVNYRATTGSTVGGEDGPFAPGRSVSMSQIAAGDGLEYTATFAERLTGTGNNRDIDSRNYAVISGTVPDMPCPDSPIEAWRGDAGSDGRLPSWVMTLYTHALPPSAPGSCLSGDGRTALIGVSSGHVGRIHVLMAGGSVRPFTPSVDAAVWKRFGTIREPLPADP